MVRVNGTWCDRPGRNTHLSQDGIENEDDWHKSFKDRMEDAGWYLKHEVVANDGGTRADFLGYHSELNRSYDDGEWVGFELKYSGSRRTRASPIAAQIEKKYIDRSWLSSGENVDIWVVAPYVEDSHTGDEMQMAISRHRELEASRHLVESGFAYLHSWHPTPHIACDRYRHRAEAFEEYDPYVPNIDVPAFSGTFDSHKSSRLRDYELEMNAEYARLQRSSDDVFCRDRDEMRRIRDKYRGGEGE
jgi:hypothetical protein